MGLRRIQVNGNMRLSRMWWRLTSAGVKRAGRKRMPAIDATMASALPAPMITRSFNLGPRCSCLSGMSPRLTPGEYLDSEERDPGQVCRSILGSVAEACDHELFVHVLFVPYQRVHQAGLGSTSHGRQAAQAQEIVPARSRFPS